MTLYYHASPDELDEFIDYTSLAYNSEDALGYLQGRPGYLYHVRVKPDLKIADEDDIQAAADALDDPILNQEDFVFTLADDWKVRDALVEAGFEAMAYEDVGPDNEYEHDTLVVFDADDLEIVKAEKIVNSRTYSAQQRPCQDSANLLSYLRGESHDQRAQRRCSLAHRVGRGRRRWVLRRSRAPVQRPRRSGLSNRRNFPSIGALDYVITGKGSFEKDLKKLPRRVQKAAAALVRSLPSNPRPPGETKKITGKATQYRVPFANVYRLGYAILDDTAEIQVLLAGHRKDVYRRMKRIKDPKSKKVVFYKTNKEALDDLERMKTQYGTKRVRDMYEEARSKWPIKEAVSHLKYLLDKQAQATYRDRDAGFSEEEIYERIGIITRLRSQGKTRKLKAMSYRDRDAGKVDLNSLRDLYLLELAKYPTFEKVYEAYRHGLRGLYWHVTDDPDFYIDSNKGPRDMSSMSAGPSMDKGKLMVTPDLADWADYYDERDYVALIDLSNVDVNDYADTTRGFGSETFVHDPAKAEVVEVLVKEEAQGLQDRFDSNVIARSEEELRDHWEQARSIRHACVGYQTNREALKDLEFMYDKYGRKKVREVYEDARKSRNIKQAVQYVKELLQVTKQASYRDRDAGKAEIELERLFAELLPGTSFEGRVFAVGGYVRDQLQHREPADLDMVIEMPYGAQRFAGFLLDEFPGKISEPEPLTYKLPIWNMHFTDDVTFNGELYRVSGAELDLTDTQTLKRLDGELDTAYGPISEDVLRRDYTVNMLYKDLTSGEILDPTGTGQTDIERGVLRARPDEDVVRAFETQPKRMLRLVRFMAQYNWEPDPEIEQAIHAAVGSLAEISGHSLQKEFNKWKKRGILDAALQFARDYGMLAPLRKAWQKAKAEETN